MALTPEQYAAAIADREAIIAKSIFYAALERYGVAPTALVDGQSVLAIRALLDAVKAGEIERVIAAGEDDGCGIECRHSFPHRPGPPWTA